MFQGSSQRCQAFKYSIIQAQEQASKRYYCRALMLKESTQEEELEAG